MATRERIGGTDAPPRAAATPPRADRATEAAPGTEIVHGAFAPGWWRHLFTRPRREPAPGTEIIYGAFAPGWWRHLFTRPRREPAPGTEIIYGAFAPGWWRYLFKRTPRQSPK